MKKLREIWRRVGFYLRRAKFERELDAEMRVHVEMKAQDKIAAGSRDLNARYSATREFGNVLLLRERSREMWAFRWIDELFQDLRYSLRMIRKSPMLATVIVASLALAIGANTAIFSLADAVLLRMLPVKNPLQLVVLEWSGSMAVVDSHSGSARDNGSGGDIGSSLTYQQFQRMSEANQTLTDLFAFCIVYPSINFSADGQADIATGQFVSGGYYRGLGVQAVLGRTIAESDDSAAAAPVAVITYAYWKKRFQLDPNVIGKKVYVNAAPFTIIGVTQPGFEGAGEVGQTADVSVPIASESVVDRNPPQSAIVWRWWLRVMGRMKPGVTMAQVRGNLEPVFRRTAQEAHEVYLASQPGSEHRLSGIGSGSPSAHGGAEAVVPNLAIRSGSRGGNFFRGDYSRQLYVLLVIVGFVLLIACVNTANLLLARARSRAKEVAVRTALGAGRTRLIRQLLTESLILSTAGGFVGLLVAYWLKDVLTATLGWRGSADAVGVRLDFPVLAFTAGVSIATGLIFGITPAIRATGIDPGPALKENSRSQTAGRARLSLGKALVVLQVSLSLMLLVGAGLFLRTLRNLEKVNYGFDASNILLFDLNPSQNGYKGENLSNVYKRAMDRISRVPRVKSASMSMFALLSGSEWTEGNFKISGAAAQSEPDTTVHLLPVGNNFLETMNIPVLVGRGLNSGDVGNSMPVAVVNQTFANSFLKDQNPIGQKLGFKADHPDDPLNADMEIVGVARDTKYDDLRSDSPPVIYMPYAQVIPSLDQLAHRMTFEVRTEGEPLSVVPLIREALRSIDNNLAISEIRTQEKQIDESMGNERLFASLTGGLGLLALLLGCIGLYAMMSYNVAGRTAEIGIRMALGANAASVMLQVIREVFILAAIGLALGGAGSFASTRLISATTFGFNSGDSNILFGVSARDPIAMTFAGLLLLAVAAIAGFLPARRAAKIDPLIALRSE